MLKDTLLYLAQNEQVRDFVTHNKATRGVSRRFVAGEDLDEAAQVTQTLNQRNIQVALDLLGENVSDAAEAQNAARNYIAALDCIQQNTLDANISIKLTALGLDISPELCEQSMRKILQRARDLNIFVCIDMEGSDYTERTVKMALLLQRDFPLVGTVIQSYLPRRSQRQG